MTDVFESVAQNKFVLIYSNHFKTIPYRMSLMSSEDTCRVPSLKEEATLLMIVKRVVLSPSSLM